MGGTERTKLNWPLAGNHLEPPAPRHEGPGIPLDAITPKVTRGRSISIKNRFKNNRAKPTFDSQQPEGSRTVHASAGGQPVTPYRGKPVVGNSLNLVHLVEIQSFLLGMYGLITRYGIQARRPF